MNTSYLIADLGLVDKHWRGRRAGPALLFFAAEILRVDAIFLKPGALVTHLNKAGRVSTDYAVPRPGPDAQKKVRKAWRRAGFTKLTDGVVWRVPPQDCGIAARAVLEEIQHEANTAKGRAWWLRRVNRAAAATSAAP